MRKKTLVLITILALTLVINVPNLSKPGAATAPPEGNGLTLTVYPDRSVGVSAQMYNSSVAYTKNVNLQHSADLTEDNSSGILNDAFPSYPTFIGRNVTFQWNAPSGQFNHTLSVVGPAGFAPVTLTIYPNATGNPLPYAQTQLSIAGNYYFNSTADTALPHTPSVLYPLTVVASEENEPPTVNYSGNLSRQTGYVSFTQTGSVVLSPFLKASIPFPLNLTDSVSVNGNYQNGQHVGTITIHTLSGASFPLNDLNLPYTVNSTYTVLRGNVTVLFNPAYPTPFENSTIFSQFFDATFGNDTWINLNISQPLNSTTGGKIQVSKFNVTADYSLVTSGLISFNVVLKGDLVQWFILGSGTLPTPPDSKLSKIFNDTLALWTSTQYTLTYIRTSGTINIQMTSHLVPDLDNQFNAIKSEFLNYTNATSTPEGLFLNQTIVLVSSLSAQVAMTPTSTWVQVTGLILKPPTVGPDSGFEEYGLFNYTGYSSDPINFTLVGGSNGTHFVNIQIPGGVPTPTSSSPTMDIWWNFQNFTKLAPIVFSVAIQTASAPINLAATAGNATVTLRWFPPASVGGGIQNYRIYRGITAGGEILLSTSTGASTSFTDNGLINGQVYYYKISAMTGGGEGPLSSEASATPSAPLVDYNKDSFTLTTNSTFTNWSYNATSGVATFKVSGNLGMGYLKIAVPKTLVQSASNVTITFDGTVVTPTGTSVGSNYVFTLAPYHYTTHTVVITLALVSTTTSTPTPFPWLIVAAVLIIIILAGGGVYWYSKRKTNLKMPPAAPTSTPTKP